MSKILAYTSPARGHLFPILPTLLELQRGGHEVHVCTLASELDRVRAVGLSARPIAQAIEARELDDWKGTNPKAAIDRTLSTFMDRAAHEVPDLSSAIAAVRPDVLFVDVNAWGAIAAAEVSKLPFAVFAPYFLDLDLPGRPPFGMGLAPARSAFSALRDRVVRSLGAMMLRPHLKKLNALRQGLGLSPIDRLGSLALQADRVVYLTAEPFEYTHGHWPSKVSFVGPGLWEPPAKEPSALTPASRPLVLVTCSSEQQNDSRLIRTALEALASEDVDVIATTAAIDPAEFTAPPNAKVLRYAPHGPILRQAAAVVCHGGMGITQKALAAGVPVCVVPFGRDQLDVARHVEMAEAGVRLPVGDLTIERMRAAVKQTITKRPGAQKIASAFAAIDGPKKSAAVLESLGPKEFGGAVHAG